MMQRDGRAGTLQGRCIISIGQNELDAVVEFKTHRRDSVMKSRHENNKIVLFKNSKIVVISEEMNIMEMEQGCRSAELDAVVEFKTMDAVVYM